MFHIHLTTGGFRPALFSQLSSVMRALAALLISAGGDKGELNSGRKDSRITSLLDLHYCTQNDVIYIL